MFYPACAQQSKLVCAYMCTDLNENIFGCQLLSYELKSKWDGQAKVEIIIPNPVEF